MLVELDDCLHGICDDPSSNREKELNDLSKELFETLHKEYASHSLFSKYNTAERSEQNRQKQRIRALLLECIPGYFAPNDTDSGTNPFVDYVYKFAHKQEDSRRRESSVDDSVLNFRGIVQPVCDEGDEASSVKNRQEVDEVAGYIKERMPLIAYKMVRYYIDQYDDKLQEHGNDSVAAEKEAKEMTVELAREEWLGDQCDTDMAMGMLEDALNQFELVRNELLKEGMRTP